MAGFFISELLMPPGREPEILCFAQDDLAGTFDAFLKENFFLFLS